MTASLFTDAIVQDPYEREIDRLIELRMRRRISESDYRKDVAAVKRAQAAEARR